MRVLVIEDDEALRGAIVRRLRAQGYAADEAERLLEGAELGAVNDYDLVILDRLLPDGDSLEELRDWRLAGLRAPVLFVSACDTVADRVAGLERGADDYLTKPFAMEELLARVAALVRRGEAAVAPVLEIGDLTVDLARQEVERGGTLLTLRPKEYALLRLLASRAGTVVSRAEIIEHCWDRNHEPMSNVEESVVASLRRKLGSPALLHTIRGSGYMLEVRD